MSSARTHVTLDELLMLRHRARGFSFLPRQPVHSLLSGRHASRVRGRGLDFEELRTYAEGDDTRAIDWAATARRGIAHVRVYKEERDRPVLLLVDQRLGMFFGSRRAMKSVVAAEAAALSAFRVTSLGDRVGAIVFSEEAITTLPPRGREVAVRAILPEIVRHNRLLRADSDKADDPGLLNRALQQAARLATHDWLVVLISDGAGADPESTRLVTGITQHNDMLFISVQDPLEAELPPLGRTVVAGSTGQIEANFAASALRHGFAENAASRRERTQRFSLNRAIPTLPLTTGRDVTEQLRELLGRRIERRRSAA